MRKFLLSSALLALIALPMHAYGGGHAGVHGFNGHHGFRGGQRVPRQPFFAWGAFDSMDPIVVVETPQLPATLPIAVPPADPKFVFPPTPTSPSPAGSHTVIVQRGSQIEVQSFPAAR